MSAELCLRFFTAYQFFPHIAHVHVHSDAPLHVASAQSTACYSMLIPGAEAGPASAAPPSGHLGGGAAAGPPELGDRGHPTAGVAHIQGLARVARAARPPKGGLGCESEQARRCSPRRGCRANPRARHNILPRDAVGIHMKFCLSAALINIKHISCVTAFRGYVGEACMIASCHDVDRWVGQIAGMCLCIWGQLTGAMCSR